MLVAPCLFDNLFLSSPKIKGICVYIGVYAFRKKALFSFSKLKKSVLEKAEMIEAIRFIESGIKIKILEVFNEYISIDTIEDLKRAKKILND